MIENILTHGLAVILSYIVFFVLIYLLNVVRGIIVFILEKLGIGYWIGARKAIEAEETGEKEIKMNSLFPIDLSRFLVAVSGNILYIPLILLLYKYIIDCILIFDIIFMYLPILRNIYVRFKEAYSIRTINLSHREFVAPMISTSHENAYVLWINDKSTTIGFIIGIIIAFYLFGGKLAESMCFSLLN
jgi:hypothetical protein